MTVNRCGSCFRPSPSATVCAECEDELRGSLRDIARLLPQLEVRLAREARFAAANDGGRSTTTPLAWDLAAGEVLDDARYTLRAWAVALPYAIPAAVEVSLPALAGWLAAHKRTLAQHPDAADAVDEITHLCKRIHRACDRPPDLVYVGPCDGDDCDQDVYTVPGRDHASCRRCGHVHDVDERRARMRRQVRDHVDTATRLVPYLELLSLHTTPSAIRWYAHAHRLVAVDHAVRGARYRLGDVVDILLGVPVPGPWCAGSCTHTGCAHARATWTPAAGPACAAACPHGSCATIRAWAAVGASAASVGVGA